MALAYVVIFAGGFWICGRLRLLGLSLALWLSLAAGIAVLALTGHSITTRWSFTPISGWHFWWIIMTSPEIFIFLFFMITDPKTVPSGRVARVVFGGLLGVVCALLMAPWGTEFGVKVGLLSGLAVMCAARPLLERRLPAKGSPDDDVSLFFVRSSRDGGAWRAGDGRSLADRRGRAAGAGPRAPRRPSQPPPPDRWPTSTRRRCRPSRSTRTWPGSSASLATPAGAQELAATLAWNLQVEAEALATGDASLLRGGRPRPAAAGHAGRGGRRGRLGGTGRARRTSSTRCTSWSCSPAGCRTARMPDCRPRGR